MGLSTSLGFFELSQKLLLEDSKSGSLGNGLMSTGRETASDPRFEVKRSGGAGGFSSSDDIFFFEVGVAMVGRDRSGGRVKKCQVELTYDDQSKARIKAKVFYYRICEIDHALVEKLVFNE